MILHLGVLDVPYQDENKSATTGQVAQILEDKYGVMTVFNEIHGQEIADDVASQLMGMLENIQAGAPMPTGDLFFPKIDKAFRDYLNSGEWEQTSGMPTKAALSGVRSGKMKKDSKARPSFIDTGLYRASFRSWIDK